MVWINGRDIDKKSRLVFWGMLIVILVLMTGNFRIEFSATWVKYFHEKYDFRKACDFVEKHLSGFDLIEYSLDSGETGGISDPKYLETSPIVVLSTRCLLIQISQIPQKKPPLVVDKRSTKDVPARFWPM